MIEHVYRRASAASSVSSVLVATDDERILEAVRAFGGVACLTSPDHPSGTDRLAEVAAELGSDIIVNVQGRSEERRVGKECRSGGTADAYEEKNTDDSSTAIQ